MGWFVKDQVTVAFFAVAVGVFGFILLLFFLVLLLLFFYLLVLLLLLFFSSCCNCCFFLFVLLLLFSVTTTTSKGVCFPYGSITAFFSNLLGRSQSTPLLLLPLLLLAVMSVSGWVGGLLGVGGCALE